MPGPLELPEAGAPSIPSTGSAREVGPGDDLFHEPEAQPESVTAGDPPEATLRGRRPFERLPKLIQAVKRRSRRHRVISSGTVCGVPGSMAGGSAW